MEFLVNAYDKTSKVKGSKTSKMREWETISLEEKIVYAIFLMDEITGKLNDHYDRTMIRIMRCFIPNSVMDYNLENIFKGIKQKKFDDLEKYLVFLIWFLDPSGPKARLRISPANDVLTTYCDILLGRFKNLLPQKCGSCRKWYAVPHKFLPETLCAKCNRGRHDCKPSPRKRDKKEDMFWFCTSCGYDATVIMMNRPKYTGEMLNGDGSETSPIAKELDDKSDGYFPEVDPEDFRECFGEATSESDYDSDSCQYFQDFYKDHQAVKKAPESVVLENLLSVLGSVTDNVGRKQDNKSKDVKNRGQKHSKINDGNSEKSYTGQNLMDDSADTKGSRIGRGTKLVVSHEEMIEAIGKLRVDAIFGHRSANEPPLHAILLIKCKEAIAGPLSWVTSQCLGQRTVPENFLKATMLLLFKGI